MTYNYRINDVMGRANDVIYDVMDLAGYCCHMIFSSIYDISHCICYP